MDISIGIDPGISTGGIAVLPVHDYSKLQTYMTPRLPTKKVGNRRIEGDIDLEKISGIMMDAAKTISENNGGNLIIVYEDVHNIHGVSSKSNFSFGCRKGEIIGIASAIKSVMPIIYQNVDVVVHGVYSITWQKSFVDYRDKRIKDGKSDTKFSSIQCAMRIFPEHSFTKERGTVPQDGMTDAALIALYGTKVL